MFGCQPVTNATRARVQRYPNLIVFIEADFNEVVAGTQRAQRSDPMLIYFLIVLRGDGFEFSDPLDCGVGQLFISCACAKRDSALDAGS